MTTSDVYDALDLQVIHALTLDGRAPFSKIGEVLGVSDQTVARRYAHLRSTNRARVTCRLDPERVGEELWFVRVRCTPSAARTIGGVLARRSDTSWVKLTSGGTEIVATVRVPASRDDKPLLLEQLPRTPQVLDFSANCLLHIFVGEPQGLVHALSPSQVSQLHRPPAAAADHVVLDDDDRQLVSVLRRDARMDFAALAQATGRSSTTLRRRLADLRASGALYFYVDIDFRDLGRRSQTMLWLSVAPDQMLAAAEALSTHPEVPFIAATTGPTNLYAVVIVPDSAALFTYLTTRVAELPAVQHMESAPVIQTLKTH